MTLYDPPVPAGHPPLRREGFRFLSPLCKGEKCVMRNSSPPPLCKGEKCVMRNSSQPPLCKGEKCVMRNSAVRCARTPN